MAVAVRVSEQFEEIAFRLRGGGSKTSDCPGRGAPSPLVALT